MCLVGGGGVVGVGWCGGGVVVVVGGLGLCGGGGGEGTGVNHGSLGTSRIFTSSEERENTIFPAPPRT